MISQVPSHPIQAMIPPFIPGFWARLGAQYVSVLCHAVPACKGHHSQSPLHQNRNSAELTAICINPRISALPPHPRER